MKKPPYWTAVVLGMLIILIIFIIAKRRRAEGFVDVQGAITTAATTATTTAVVGAIQTAIASPTGSTITTNIAQYYEGNNAVIPYSDKMYIYLSSFSGVQSDQSTLTFSGNGVPIWRSLVNEEVYFNVVGTDLPSSIAGGLPMLGTRLIGPPSENTAFPNTNYILPSFTAAWYANWKSLEFETDAPIILLRMFAENPNHVQISVRQVDSNTVALDAVVGNASSVYSWEIPKTTLLTQGTGTLYAFVYNREEKKISFNIGSTIKYPRVLTDTAVVKLGNTPVDINYNQNWNADLKAFMFYRSAITDFSTIYEYLGQQASGVKLMESTAAAATEALQQTTTLSDEDLANLRDELELTRQQLYNNRLELRKCMQTPEDIDPNTFRRWQLKDGLYPGQYTSLNQCKELNINNLDDIKARLAQVLINAFAGPLQNVAKGGVNTRSKDSDNTGQRTLYTTFPNDSFNKKKTDDSIYVATPYPSEPAKAPPLPFKLKSIITQFGQGQTIPQAVTIANAQLLPQSTTTAAAPAVPMDSPIPVAPLLPRAETSESGVTLMYADPLANETVEPAAYTNAVPPPTDTSATESTYDAATASATAPLMDDKTVWDRIKDLFA